MTIHPILKDPANYRVVCERMLDRFEADKDPRAANNVAWVCALAPNVVKDPSRAVRLAKRAVEIEPSNTNRLDALGAVLYRAGDPDGTIERLEKGSGLLNPWHLTGLYDRAFPVMAYHATGRAEEAGDMLERVMQHLEPQQPRTGTARDTIAMDAWKRRELDLLTEEAGKLISTRR